MEEYLDEISVEHLVDAAIDLVDDPTDSEYKRALVELLANVIGCDHDATKFLIAKLLKVGAN